MHYARIRATGEVLGGAWSSGQDSDFLARYAEALGVNGVLEMFESDTDPRPADARTEPAPEPEPDRSITDQVAAMQAQLAKLMAKMQ